MSITTFFDSLQLHLTFEDTSLFNKFKELIDTKLFTHHDVTDCLTCSFTYEGKTITQSTINNIISMQCPLNIPMLYKYVEPRLPCKRTTAVYVNDAEGTCHIGQPQSKINIDLLQHWVITFQTTQFDNPLDKMFVGFVLYLMYVRIHPHQDGNGRMARYLFLENMSDAQAFVPLSKLLMSDLYCVTSAICKVMSHIDIKDNAAKADYYTLHFTNRVVKNIYYIIYMSLLYNHCLHIDPNFLHHLHTPMFCLNEYQHNPRCDNLHKFYCKLFNMDRHIAIIELYKA